MWMLPFKFVTRTDLELAAKGKDVSQDTRNTFLNKLWAEHSQPGVREQLHTMWTEWMDSYYAEEPALDAVFSYVMDAATPPDDEEEMH